VRAGERVIGVLAGIGGATPSFGIILFVFAMTWRGSGPRRPARTGQRAAIASIEQGCRDDQGRA
jgi:hypothetical protein